MQRGKWRRWPSHEVVKSRPPTHKAVTYTFQVLVFRRHGYVDIAMRQKMHKARKRTPYNY